MAAQRVKNRSTAPHSRPSKGKSTPKSDPRLPKKFSFARTKSTQDSPDHDEHVDFEAESESEDSQDSDESSIHGDIPAINAYSTLLQSLSSSRNGPPPAKKRKLSEQAKTVDAETQKGTPQQEPFLEDSELGLDEPYVGEAESGDDADDIDDIDADFDDGLTERDPFTIHYSPKDESGLQKRIEDVKSNVLQKPRITNYPDWKVLAAASASSVASKKTLTYDDLVLKQKLRDQARQVKLDLETPINAIIAQSLFTFEDILFTDRSPSQGSDLRRLAGLHAVNHVLKTRDRVLKNAERLAKQSDLQSGDFRDQGFTRPKVLFLLPTRQSCVKMIEAIMSFYRPGQQENKKRFQDAYNDSHDSISSDKPDDFRDLFTGNDDDMFRIGLKFTRKTVKYFGQFYNSDIIFASPLGLRMAIGSENSKQDHDFLSSIEVVIVDQTDAMLMQNWDHVEHIFSRLNLLPKESHGCDFSRVRSWYLDGNAKYLRQTVIFSAFNTPEINKLFSSHMQNIEGKVKVALKEREGTLASYGVQFKQVFHRFDAADHASEPDARFKYFTARILPSIVKRCKSGSGPHGMLLFVPSYLDFVRVRNFLAGSTAAQDIPFGSISEYTQAKDVARARSHFMTGRHALLLYSGRAHHFRRYQLKGVATIFFYSLPDNPIFYKELTADFLGRSLAEGTAEQRELGSQALFSRWDAMRLERIVGTPRVGLMLGEKSGDTFTFM